MDYQSQAARRVLLPAPSEGGTAIRAFGFVLVAVGVVFAGLGVYLGTAPSPQPALQTDQYANALRLAILLQGVAGGVGIAVMGCILIGLGGVQQSIARWAAWHAHVTGT